ncbi:MAG: diacylglycerol kinase family lipid kinase [Rikenellaceae bacterium]|nr:diacylglycerol kinase family lipid kinase [Rikenellaceae bacterium]
MSGRGRGGRDWPRIAEMLDQAGISYTFNFSPARYEAIDLAESVVRMGYRKIIAVGGDGTMHEVLNGLWRQKDVPLEQLTVGVIPVGTGNDWVRHVGIPHDYKKAIDIITKGRVYQQDIIRARYRTPQGESERVVANIAGIGLDAEVIKAVEADYERGRKGRTTYIKCLLQTVFRHRPQPFRITIDGIESDYPKMFTAAVGNNRFNGGGLEQLPCALSDDGLAEVMILRELSLGMVPRALWLLLQGRINEIPTVDNFRVRSISFESVEASPVELDGELVGKTRVDFDVIPRALRVIVP